MNPTQLFALRQALAAWDHYQGLIDEVDREIEVVLKALADSTPRDPTPGKGASGSPPTKPAKKSGPNSVAVPNLAALMWRICGGHDATQIPGLTDSLISQLVGEVGLDMGCCPSDKHFTAWLGLAPGSNQSGKRKGRWTMSGEASKSMKHNNSKRNRRRSGILPPATVSPLHH